VRRFVYLALLVAAAVVPSASTAVDLRLPGTIAYSDRIWRPNSDSWEILVFKATGGATRSMTENVSCFDAGDPAWSRGGSMLAFECGVGSNEIAVIWHDGSGFRRLPGHASGVSPSWSPDRQEVAFVGKEWIWIANIWSGRKRKVTRSSGYDLSWSPDGKRIVFDGGKKSGIWIVGVDGRGLRRLTRRQDRDPAWSADGRRIAFMRGHGVYT
jgi:Tol biopolymer transport system component